MIKNKANFYFLFAAAFFLFGSIYTTLFKKELFVVFNLIPFLLFALFIFIVDIEKMVWLMVLSTPLAITLKELGLSSGLDLSLPTEPIMASLMLVYWIHALKKRVMPIKIMQHPITILIIVQLLWMLFTTLTSVDGVVSLKYFISRCWFVFSSYFVLNLLFTDFNKARKFIFFYAIPLAVVCIITIVKHAPYGFDDKIADWIVSPFYNDHTAYGAALAMFIPVCTAFLFLKNNSIVFRFFIACLLLLFLAAIILSYARAGWLSLVVAFLILITLLFRIKFKILLTSFLSILLLFFLFQNQIIRVLGKNDTDSEGDFSKNISSITNISTDASNLERLNRWSCAIRMFKEKPVLGWGPGTYMFKYATFQKASEKTIISTNFGTNGNAHSEYLGPLCEQGILGLLLVILLLFSSMFLGYRVIFTETDYNRKVIAIGVFLGLVTYFVHGFLNNFLDTDKLSLPFWGFLSFLVCMDVANSNKKELN